MLRPHQKCHRPVKNPGLEAKSLQPIAAYNAGPKRVRYWKKINKNPQKNQIDYVNWIELIKFKETRNYVQRVLENYNVYRYILAQKPVTMINFFKDDPLY
mgnify:CR=1 FL=1